MSFLVVTGRIRMGETGKLLAERLGINFSES